MNDPGLPIGVFRDYIRSHGDYMDYVKFGWGTALVTRDIEKKIEELQSNNIGYFFGGTLFEFFYSRDQLSNFVSFAREHSCKVIEISDGTIEIPAEQKLKVINDLANEFNVWTEIGYKDQQRSLNMPPSKWIEDMNSALAAGSQKVITEARESGTSGICSSNGEVRFGLIEDIIKSEINLNDVIFEAPTQVLQVYFINKLGPGVNLANIPFIDTISLETLRQGLRSDTFNINNSKSS
jgi:phosphosulfolactate synthase